MTALEADVAVLGAGFGGSLTAFLLDRAGLDVVAVDRASHPRFRIGESSTPTANMILRTLADRYDAPRLRPLASHGPWREHYPEVTGGRKRGFSYFRHRDGEAFAPGPDHDDELLVAASSDPYHSDTQWLRADVDAFLARMAREAGVPVLERTEVTEVARDGGSLRVRAHRPEGELSLRAGFVVDATGTGALPGNGGPAGGGGVRGGGNRAATRTRALYGHFRGLPPWRETVAALGGRTEDHPFPCGEAALHHVLDDGWMWELRFDDGRVSAGLVLDLRKHPRDPELSPETEWRRRLSRYPTLADRFAGAELVDPPGRIVGTSRLQRATGRVAGRGWARLPSAAGFVDPLHSTGIAHTMSGIERLVGLLESHGPSPPPAPLREYGEAVADELRFVDQLTAACYDALPSFRGWVASSKLYFAAATTYERVRARGGPAETERAGAPRFLCADEAGLRRAAREARERLADWPSSDRPIPERVAGYERFLEGALRPYDEVGLFDPEVPRMHPHTAAPRPETAGARGR